MVNMYLFKYILLLLAFFATPAISSSANESISVDIRNPRVTGRIVKLYSGSRPEPIHCAGEGFQGDPKNCAVFYRCIKSNNGKYTVFRFQCGPGTIYDPATEVCNHPKNTRRSECTGALVTNSGITFNIGNEIDSAAAQEIPTPIKINLPDIKEDLISVSTAHPFIFSSEKTTSAIKFTTETSSKHSTQSVKQNNEDTCTHDGFMGDSNNCRTFYRCVNNGRGGFIKYEFSCSESTIWDDEIQSCNHPPAVKRSRCGRSSDNQRKDINLSKYDTFGSKLKIPKNNNKLNRTSEMLIQDDKSSKVQNQKPTQISTNKTDKNPMSDDVFFSKTDVSTQKSQQLIQNYGSNDHDDAIQNNNQNKPIKAEESQITNDCTSSGFKSDPNDCKKFYRCVNNGNGGFTRYEFLCGEGTVWDPNIEACNHAWAVKKCGNEAQTESSSSTSFAESTTKPPQTTQRPQTITTEETSDESDTGYGNQNQVSSSTNRPPSPSKTTTENTQTETVCTHDGFIGEPSDCKKFYRCVDNGNGGFTRYEFTCGEGTVWDPNIEACNHAWAVKKCGNEAQTESSISTSFTETTSETPQTTQRPQITTTEETSDESESGYGNQNQESSSTNRPPSPSQTTTENTQTETVCTHDGFIGEPSDCKKFYRCVDNGRGSYTKFEFTCGEGTVWDPEIEACNHAWAVNKCGETSSTNTNKVETTTKATDTVDIQGTSESTVSNPQFDIDTDDNGYGLTESSTESSSITTKQTTLSSQINENNVCKSSGFIGDSTECKKFYRCVDDGKGGYTRYEFSCGEGTVWDQTIEACNHAWAVKSCNNGDHQNIQQTTSSSESVTSDNDHQMSSSVSTSTTTEQVNTVTNNGDQTSATKQPTDTFYCSKEGFFGDNNDCKKFYRCVDNGKKGFTKYEFTCGEGTIWDQEIHGCNHPSSSNKCSNGQSTGITTKEPDHENDEMQTTTTQGSTENTYSSSESTSTQPPPKQSTIQPQSSSSPCGSEGFYADPIDCKKFYRCVDNGKGVYTKYDFSCGDGTVWDQEILACNHESDSCKSSSINDYSTTTESQKTTQLEQSGAQNSTTTESPFISSTSSQEQCSSDGFYPNQNDCKKFYRCVDNGKGGYTKYDFTCGEGTIWVQEIQSCDHDNDLSSCSHKNNSSNQQQPTSTTTSRPQASESTNQASTSLSTTTEQPGKDSNENPNETTSRPGPDNSGQCNSEGFYANKYDCRKFYRCVDNGHGKYTKYDFTCGEGTAWDSNIQACNHINEVKNCNSSDQSETRPPVMQDEVADTTETSTSSSTTGSNSPNKTTTTTTTSRPSNETKPNNKDDKCTEEGYFGNYQDCKKFYRCVDNGKGDFTKYDFDCGEGTVWDQDITACNHPRDVSNPSCKDGYSETTSTTTTEANSQSQDQSTSASTQTSSQSSTESSSQGSSNCSQESTSKKPENKKINCTKEGYYEDPDDCKKFHRCVDWDGNGEKFSVYHFECGDGTIWDPSLDTCNHEDSVYPPRDCSGKETQSENEKTTTTTSQEQTTTTQSTTTEIQTTTEKQQSTTEQQSTITEQHTTAQQTTQTSTSKPTTTEESSTSEQTSTDNSKEETTTQKSTTSEQTTTEKDKVETTTTQTTSEETTTQQSTTQQSNTSEQTTTEKDKEETTTKQTTNEETTTQQSTTQKSTTSEQTTTEKSSTTEQTIAEQSNNTQSTSSDTTTEQQSTTSEQSSTEQTQQTTTEKSSTTDTSTQTSTTQNENESTTIENQETTTEGNNETSSEKPCPETEDDQYLYVCPTGFRRHPKFCNLFYQCTENDETHEVKVATFNCPNNTIYDENKTQCVEENKAEKKCDGQIAQKKRFKRLDTNLNQPMVVNKQKLGCPSTGHFPFDKNDECSSAFLKCERAKSGKIRGFMYQCPVNYVYWSVSRRCELKSKIRNCKNSDNNWSGRYEIPFEKNNVALN